MKTLAVISALMAGLLPSCARDESVAGYGASGHVWHLQELDNTPFAATATLEFPEAGRIAGQAPCNRYHAEMSVPYPWFETGPIAATRMACPDLAAEQLFLTALSEMTLAEVLGDVLILSNTDGRNMVFKAAAPAPE